MRSRRSSETIETGNDPIEEAADGRPWVGSAGTSGGSLGRTGGRACGSETIASLLQHVETGSFATTQPAADFKKLLKFLASKLFSVNW